MPIHLIPQDKANHQVYGARIAAVAAAFTAAALTLQGGPGAGALLWAAVAGLSCALLAGRLKEWLDARANAAAEAAGLPPPHGVERADIVATVWGGVTVAVPLVVAGLLAAGVGP